MRTAAPVERVERVDVEGVEGEPAAPAPVEGVERVDVEGVERVEGVEGVELEPAVPAPVERAPGTPGTPAYVGRCPRCMRGVSVDRDTARDAGYQVKSTCCGRWTVVQKVAGTVTARECGAHCEDATSRRCQCECGGTRHGVTWRVSSSSAASTGSRPDKVATFEPDQVATFELIAPTIAPVDQVATLQPLEGVEWPREVAPSGVRTGQVAMFDVLEPGSRQEWGRRGSR